MNATDSPALAERLDALDRKLDLVLAEAEEVRRLRREFLQDATPLARQLFTDVLGRLDELDRKGYFAMGRELARALDNVVTHFTPEDARRLADNIVVMMETFKNLTQPEMLLAVNNAMEIYRKLDFGKMEEVSLWGAIREVNKPEMRRALGFLLSFLRNLAEHPVAATAPAPAPLSSNR